MRAAAAVACLVATAAVLALAPVPARAQSGCGDYAELATALRREYDERLWAVMRMAKNGMPVELWRSAGGRSWTMVLRISATQACLFAAGDDLAPLEPEPCGRPA